MPVQQFSLFGINAGLELLLPLEYSQFYWEGEFCHYNMFNHHFFGGEAAKMVFQKFLQEEDGKAALLVTDPPFGGLVEPLAFSFKRLREMGKTTNPENESNLPILWMFPYFFESRILQCFPGFPMLRYQVDYNNHALYKHGKTGRRQSPVRIFTDIPPDKIVLPAIEVYGMASSNAIKYSSQRGTLWLYCSL
uniref:Uncharacterized protein n=1 Tax=Xenopus tropicalis TaxID=8364 RepID=A0A6I8RX77_XENTR